MREFPPVDPIVRPGGLGQTFLSHVDQCARSGYLYLRHHGGAASHAMDRGTAFHEFARRYVELLVERGEHEAPPEVAKDLMGAVIEDNPHLHLTSEAHDELRAMAWNTAEGLWLDSAAVAGTEVELELTVLGVPVRCRVDLVLVWPDQRYVEIWDWKTSFAVPSESEVRKLFQPRFYALAVAEGTGVDVPAPLGRGADMFRFRLVYPRYRRMQAVEATFERSELPDLEATVAGAVRRAERGFAVGEWSPVAGAGCATCPAPHECPLPAQMIPAIDLTLERPEEVAERIVWLERERDRESKRLRAWAEEHGGITAAGYRWAWQVVAREQIKRGRREDLKEAIRQAGLDPGEWFETRTTTSLVKSAEGSDDDG